MLAEEQDRVVVVLVRARNPANIGAVARAMHDFGYARLRIVNGFPVPFAAAKSAVDASSVLEAAEEAATVADAVADCTLVLGTTAVGERVLEHPLHTLGDAVPMVAEHLGRGPRGRVALLFGSEKTGLSNEELSHCNALVTIPMNTRTAQRHLSMNLGQAAAVSLYAISEGLGADSRVRTPLHEPGTPLDGVTSDHAASAGDLERLTDLLRETLERSGYGRRHPANAREVAVRRLVRRMEPSGADAAVWTGILRQILYKLADEANGRESKL